MRGNVLMIVVQKYDKLAWARIYVRVARARDRERVHSKMPCTASDRGVLCGGRPVPEAAPCKSAYWHCPSLVSADTSLEKWT